MNGRNGAAFTDWIRLVSEDILNGFVFINCFGHELIYFMDDLRLVCKGRFSVIFVISVLNFDFQFFRALGYIFKININGSTLLCIEKEVSSSGK